MILTLIINPKVKKLLFFLLIIGFNCQSSIAQDLTNSKKFEYSTYLYFRVNKKSYIDNFNLTCFDSKHHQYAFMQNDIIYNYKKTKKLTLILGYAFYLNKWSAVYHSNLPIYQNAYSSRISSFGTIMFHRPTIGFKYKFFLTKKLRLEESLTYQCFIPSMEKYQSRLVLGSKLTYDNKKLPLEFEPFAQMIYYYYLNGEPSIYYDENGNYQGYYSPNGLHRYRFRLGFKIKPFKSIPKFDFMLYLAGQREFNFRYLGGHDINTSRPNVPMTQKQNVNYAYNSYGILGIQLNYVFDKKGTSRNSFSLPE